MSSTPFRRVESPQLCVLIRPVPAASEPLMLLGETSVPTVASAHVVHEPVPQVVMPVHAVPHVPQFAASVCVFASHPSVALPLQSAKPALHENPHPLDAHVAVAFARAG